MAIGSKPRTGREPATGWAAIRPLVLRLHFYAGVFVGPFLLVAALTGIAYVWTPQLEQAVYAHELHVPAAAGAVPLDQQVLIARGQVPDGKVIGVRPAPSATDTTQVIFNRPGLAPSYRYTVFVNPHDGEIRGALETYGSGQAMPVRGWIDTLHRNLHLGDFGRLYSELAASWLWVITLAGAALWLGRRRLRAALLPSPGKPGRARLRSWHGATGLWIAAGLLFLSATGLTWSLHAGANITDLRSSLDWTTPSVSSAARTPGDVGWQAARDATARAGLSDPVEIRPPSDGGYVVQQVGRSWPSKQDSMAVDPGTGKVTGTLRFADYPLAAKLSRWGIDAHMGLLFGVANQIVLTVLGVALLCVVTWGYRMWWLRGRGRTSAGGGWLLGGARSGGVPGDEAGWGRSAESGESVPGQVGSGQVVTDGARRDRSLERSRGEGRFGGLPVSGGLLPGPGCSGEVPGREVRSGRLLVRWRKWGRVGRSSVSGGSLPGQPDSGEVLGREASSGRRLARSRGWGRVGRSSGRGGSLSGQAGSGEALRRGAWSGRRLARSRGWGRVGRSSVSGESLPGQPDSGEVLGREASSGRLLLSSKSLSGQADSGQVSKVRPDRLPERSRGRGRFGRLPVRGAWRRIPGRVLAPVLVAMAVVGWFLPVFGVSLLGFLAVDCLLGLRREAAR